MPQRPLVVTCGDCPRGGRGDGARDGLRGGAGGRRDHGDDVCADPRRRRTDSEGCGATRGGRRVRGGDGEGRGAGGPGARGSGSNAGLSRGRFRRRTPAAGRGRTTPRGGAAGGAERPGACPRRRRRAACRWRATPAWMLPSVSIASSSRLLFVAERTSSPALPSLRGLPASMPGGATVGAACNALMSACALFGNRVLRTGAALRFVAEIPSTARADALHSRP